MNKCYYRIVWENYPSDRTPLNEQNLNKIDVATDEMDNRIISLDSTKFDKSEAQMLVKHIEYDEETGIFKITHYNGASYTIDTLLEKLAVNFDYDYQTQRLIIMLSDGEIKYVDLSALITQYEFLDSETVHFTISGDGKVKAEVKEGSIQEKHLRPEYLADIRVESAKAEASAVAADTSEKAAKVSETAAKESEINAAASATESANKATEAAVSATTATQKSEEAATSAQEAADSAKESAESEASSLASAETAGQHAAAASTEAEKAAGSAIASTVKAEESEESARLSQSYAIGTGGEVRENDDTDCAEYYYEQAKRVIQGVSGIVPMGTITFEGLSDTEHQKTGYMFNISDSFVSDERFSDGGGIFYGAGNNVLYTAEGKWDVLAGAMVSGVKGAEETEYRQGFVNITAMDIGAIAKHKKTILLNDDIYDTNTYYPVTGTRMRNNEINQMEVMTTLGRSGTPPWSTHAEGFFFHLAIEEVGSGWGANNGNRLILANNSMWTDKNCGWYKQLNSISMPVFFLRGGGIYYVTTDYECDWTIHTSTYEPNEYESVTPTTTLEETAWGANLGTDIRGNSFSADRAVADKHGNDIADMYVRRNDLLNLVYPVGAIYMSVSSANPGTIFGGTWAAWGTGRVPVGVSSSETEFNAAEKTGGEKTHTLTESEMPSHYHATTATTVTTTTNGEHSHTIRYSNTANTSGTGARANGAGTLNGYMLNNSGAHAHNTTIPALVTSNKGSNTAHNNLQPYITCYMWKRVS